MKSGKNDLGQKPERRVVMPSGALNFSKMTSVKMSWGKSPERRVVMPAGAFKFLKKCIRHNFIKKVGVIDERSLNKSHKHHARAAGEAAIIAKIIKICRFGAQQRCPLVECDRKSKRFRREVPQKVKKTSRESVGRGRKHCKNHQNLPIWRSAAVPPGRMWSKK